MKIEYNNKNYHFNKYQTLGELLSRKEFLKLPLSIWKEILMIKTGSVSAITLYEILLAKINFYDNSEDVNSFIVNGIDFWLDKNTRVGLAHLANCTEGVMQLVLGDTVLEIESSVMKEMLVQLERYAAQCYLQTQKHLLAIKELKTVEDLINYDYTKGYPDKLTFTV